MYMKCEYCQTEHDGKYGSGRFCSEGCKQKFVVSKRNPESRKKTGFYKGHQNNQYSKAKQLGLPPPIVSKETRAKLGARTKGTKLSDEQKQKISESMKKARSEGRANNIGKCRWNNEPSYPERFFMQVIDNEFQDKEYKKEFPFGKFSLDFAWPHKNKCIEIDGEQHEKPEYKARDNRKNKLLKDKGWEFLRVKWKVFYKKPKLVIKILKAFIDGV